jgi:hypothetical protein
MAQKTRFRIWMTVGFLMVRTELQDHHDAEALSSHAAS